MKTKHASICLCLSDPRLDGQRRRHSSGGISTTLEMLPGLEGVELDMYGRVRACHSITPLSVSQSGDVTEHCSQCTSRPAQR